MCCEVRLEVCRGVVGEPGDDGAIGVRAFTIGVLLQEVRHVAKFDAVIHRASVLLFLFALGTRLGLLGDANIRLSNRGRKQATQPIAVPTITPGVSRSLTFS